MPEELVLSTLQQSIGSEYEMYIRILIHQRTLFEKIKAKLLTYEATYKAEASNEVKYIPVNGVKQTNSGEVKKTAFVSSRNQLKYKITVTASKQMKPRRHQDTNNRTCFNCKTFGHMKNNCRNSNKCNSAES